MATTKKIIADLGSEELKQVRLQVNNLVDAVEGLKVATIANADAGGTYTSAEQDLINEIKTALNAVAAVDLTGLRKLVATLELAAAPSIP